jgi:hypothetical protein
MFRVFGRYFPDKWQAAVTVLAYVQFASSGPLVTCRNPLRGAIERRARRLAIGRESLFPEDRGFKN